MAKNTTGSSDKKKKSPQKRVREKLIKTVKQQTTERQQDKLPEKLASFIPEVDHDFGNKPFEKQAQIVLGSFPPAFMGKVVESKQPGGIKTADAQMPKLAPPPAAVQPSRAVKVNKKQQ